MSIGPMMACASFGVHRGEKLFSVREVAEIIFDGKSERFVRDLIAMGRLEAVNISVDLNGRRELVVRESAIDKFLQNSSTASISKTALPAMKPVGKRRKKVDDGFSAVIQEHLRTRRK